MTAPRVLVAGVGNLFLGDDGFGPEVVRRLASAALPSGVTVMDAGVRAFDLEMALAGPYDTAILVDVAARGHAPGTLSVLEPDGAGAGVQEGGVADDGHTLNLNHVLARAAAAGSRLPVLRIVACEPLAFGSELEPALGLSEPVERAVEPALEMIRTLLEEFGVDTGRAPRTAAGRSGAEGSVDHA